MVYQLNIQTIPLTRRRHLIVRFPVADTAAWFWSITGAIGDRHEAHADGRVLVSPDDDLALTLAENLPAECLRPEPGQPGQIVSVNDDAIELDRHSARMCGCRRARPSRTGSTSTSTQPTGSKTKRS